MPVVASVSPDFGPIVGGNSVTINGIGFTGATEVTFGSIGTVSLTGTNDIISDTEIQVDVPTNTSATPSSLQVGVTDSSGQSLPMLATDTYGFGYGQITGTITDSKTSSPIAGICPFIASGQTSVINAQSSASLTTVGTNSYNYAISPLAPGSYTVGFEQCASNTLTPGYVLQYYNGTTEESLATPVSVTQDITTPNINAAMVQGGTISGTVTDTSTPANDLSGICVNAYDTAVSGGGQATTNSSGSYSITGLPAGTGYVLTFSNCSNAGNYAQDSVSGVSVVAGQVTTEDATLSPGGAISGTVTDTSTPANDLSGICVRAYSSTTSAYGQTTTSSSGSYSVTGLPAGSYQIQFYPCGTSGDYIGQSYAAGGSAIPTPVTVTAGGTLTGIDATLSPGGAISGTVTDTSTPANDLSGICVRVAYPNGFLSGTTYVDTFETTSSTGSYTVEGLPPLP